MAVVRELVTRFGFAVDTTAQARVEGSIQRISGLLSGIAAFASLRALANVADSMQSLEARIAMLPQTIGDVGAAFNEVSRNATANRQSIEAYGTLYARVGNAAKDFIKDQSALIKVSNTISQALVVGGATTQEAASVMTQFSQALGSGTLQGEEFRAMAEAAPQYLDALAEALDVPRGQMKKLASEGKITTKAVIEATQKMSSMFEEKFSRMPMTIGQATTVMGNRFKTMIAGMNRETQIVTTIANSMLGAFDRIEAGFGRVVDAVGGFSNALKLAGIAVAAILGPLALSGLVTILGAILSPAGLVVGALVAIGLVIDDLITYLNGGQSAFGQFLDTLRTDPIMGVLVAVLGFVTTLRLLSSGIVVAIARFAALGVAALVNGAKIGAGLLLAMGPIGLLIAAFAALAAGIYLVSKNWESIKAFFGFGGTVAPSSIASAGKGGSVVNSNQTVNLTVPPGTPESQQKFLQDAAAKAFESDPLAGLSHNLGMVGP